MSFIENLRRDFEFQKKVAAEATLLAARAAKEEAERIEREREIKELHAARIATERHNQALLFQQESRVSGLVAKLGELLREIQSDKSKRKGMENYIVLYEKTGVAGSDETTSRRISLAGSSRDCKAVSRYLKDKDSAVDLVFWDRRMRYVSYPNARTGEVRSGDQFDEKLIVVETCPNGTIRFHAGWLGSSCAEYAQWKDNLGILDSRLERAYRNPLSHTYITNVEYGSNPCKSLRPGEHGWIGIGTG